MTMSEFIRANLEPILSDWEAFAGTLVPDHAQLDSAGLRDFACEILLAVADDMDTMQTLHEQTEKSRGRMGRPDSAMEATARRHAAHRLTQKFTLNEVVAEYRALRASVTGRWTHTLAQSNNQDVEELTRFGEAIDESQTASIFWYDALLHETEEALREARDRLKSKADALARIHDASSRLWRNRNPAEGLEVMLDSAMALLGADMGNLQLYSDGVLKIAAHRGLGADFLDAFREVRTEDPPACARTLRTGKPVLIEDVVVDAEFAPLLPTAHAAGYRAVHSTPLISRDGEPLGVISAYFRNPHRPDEQDLQAFELYAREAVSFLERGKADEALRESEARFREMANGLPVIVWMHDADGRQEMVNDTFCEFFGVTRKEMTGDHWRALLHEDDAEAYRAAFSEALAAQHPFAATARVRRRDGEWRWVESVGRPRFTLTGDFRGMVGTSVDITDRLEAEDKLREASRAKDEFLAVLGHELRNPLAPLRTSLDLVQETGGDGQLLEQVVPTMDRQLTHLTRLVDDLLDISRVTLGKFELQKAAIDLRRPIEAAIEQVDPLIADQGHEFSVSIEARAMPVQGDFERLTQVVANLLVNACSHTEPGGRISITCGVEDGQAAIRVEDTGYGIPAEYLQEIFELFGQVPGHPARGAGANLGVGLALAQKIVEMHGGTLKAFSAGAGCGSEFTLRLPLSAGRSDAAASGTPNGQPLASRRILVVDDNEDVTQTLRMLLEIKGHVVDTAHDGPTALRQMEAFDPDIVLLDLGLPGMDGIEVARQVRAERGGGRPVIVALTGWGQEAHRELAQEARFDEFLIKPVRSRQIEELIAKY